MTQTKRILLQVFCNPQNFAYTQGDQTFGTMLPIEPITIGFASANHRSNHKLVHSTLEEALAGGSRDGESCKLLAQGGSWSDEAGKYGVLFDLSKVLWCDLTACVHFLLVLERALRDGLPQVIVAVPDSSLTLEEREEITRLERRHESGEADKVRRLAGKRLYAGQFLSRIKFFEALGMRHLPTEQRLRLRVVADYGSRPEKQPWRGGTGGRTFTIRSKPEDNIQETSIEDDEDLSEDAAKPPFTFLRWLPTQGAGEEFSAQMAQMWEELSALVRHAERDSLLDFEADDFTNIVFSELRQNVEVHAGRGVTHLLVGAWVRHRGFPVVPEYYLPPERDFFVNSVRNQALPFVDVVLGDSGAGILDTLREAFRQQHPPFEAVPRTLEGANEDERLLFWSMGRWSSKVSEESFSRSEGAGSSGQVEVQHAESSPVDGMAAVPLELRRGTRGLYRVLRLVRAYRGLLTIRSGDALAGWNFGNAIDQKPVYGHGRGWVPGTLAQMRFVIGLRVPSRLPQAAHSHRDVEYLFAPPLKLTNDSSVGLEIGSIRELLSKRDPSKRYRCVIALMQKVERDAESRKSAMEKMLFSFRQMPNPGALVVCALKFGKEELRNYIESLNEQITKFPALRWPTSGMDACEPSNPFMILGRDGVIHWAGVCTWEVPLLKALETAGLTGLSRKEAQTYIAEAKNFERTWQDLKQHPDLFGWTAGDSVHLRFTSKDIRREIVERVKVRLLDAVQRDPRREERKWVDPVGPYLMPTLQLAQRWIHVAKVVEDFGVFHTSHDRLAHLRSVSLPCTAPKKLLSRLADKLAVGSDGQFETIQEVLEVGGTPTLADANTAGILAKVLDTLELRLGVTAVVHALALRVREGIESKNAEMVAAGKEKIEFPHYVLREPGSMVHVANGLRWFLGISRRVLEVPSVRPLREASEVWDIVRKHPILVYTDVLMSGEGVRRVISQLIRESGHPVGIACIFDLRPNGDNGRPIKDSGLEFSVFSLVNLPGLVDGVDHTKMEEGWKVVNPMTLDTSAPAGEVAYPIATAEVMDVARASGALRYGHFALPQNRHFLFIFDPVKLMRHAHLVTLTRQALEQEWQQFQSGDLGNAGGQHQKPVVYVEHVGWDEGTVRQMIESSPLLQGCEWRLFRRAQSPGSVTFTGQVSGRHVLLLVWSAISGTSVQSYILRLAEQGARSVLACVWLSRMPPQAEHLLTCWNRLAVNQVMPALDGQSELFNNKRTLVRSDVPVRVRFLAKGVIATYHPHECPVCIQRERIDREWRKYPSKAMELFAEEYVGGTRPVDMSHMAEEEEEIPTYWHGVSGEMVIRMLLLRAELEQMREDTRGRLKVRGKIAGLRAQLQDNPVSEEALLEAQAWMHLLATELEWVKDPPLSFERVRDDLATISKKLLLEFHRSLPEISLRQAVIVLRATHKIEFAKALPDIFERHIESRELLMQVLYDCFTYIESEYHHYPFYLDPMAFSLMQMRESYEKKHLRRPSVNPEVDSLLDTLVALSNRAEELLATITVEPNPSQNWVALRAFLAEQMRDNHQTLPQIGKDLNLYGRTRLGEHVGTASFWAKIRTRWVPAREILQVTVVPRLSQLLQYIEAEFAKEHWDRAGGRQLVLAFLHNIINGEALREIDHLLEGFSQNAPTPGSQEWEKFVQLRQLYWKVLLEPSNKLGEGGAALWRFLAACPCAPVSIILKHIDDPRWTAKNPVIYFDPGTSTRTVFCHEVILDELMEELLKNALERHIPPPQSEEEDEPVIMEIFVELGYRSRGSEGRDPGEELCLVFKNTGSDPNYRKREDGDAGGVGLNIMMRNLRVFGGDLFHRAVKDDKWSYEVVAFLGKEV
jgi:hypothetical protein